MPRPRSRIEQVLLLVCLILLPFIYQSAFAQESEQETGTASLSQLETSEFPQLTTYLEAHDASGNFIYGLQPGDVSIVENGENIQVEDLVMLRPGAQFVLAVGSGESLSVRDSQGKTRYTYLVEAVEKWVQARRGSTLDELSFLPSGGSEVSHVTDLDTWLASVKSYIMVSQETLPGLDILGRALEIAADPVRRPGMGRGVLFVTTLPERDFSEEIQSLAARANQRGVRIFVWLVGSPEQFDMPQATQLADLASLTGGSLFAFAGREEIPELESYLEPLRNKYYLTYPSRISESGVHQVSAIVKKDGYTASTPIQQFDLNIQPPAIAFVSTPAGITRNVSEGRQESQVLVPQSQSIYTRIEFPDGYARTPARSALYVDGKLADQNTSEPFHTFQWDLREYSSTGQHLIRAEVEDSLGLVGTTPDIPVIVTVNIPVANRVTSFVRYSRNPVLLAAFSVFLAGSVLGLILIIGGRLKPDTLLQIRRKRRLGGRSPRPANSDIEPPPVHQPRWMNRLHWPARPVLTKPLASLVRISDTDAEDTAPPIAITSAAVTFGSDPAEAAIVLMDPSVEALHARLVRQPDGTFCILDCGSIAGTWVNFSPVPEAGMRLEHGDRIHLGQVAFLFQQKEREHLLKPVIHMEGSSL